MNQTKLITIRNEFAAFSQLQRTELSVTYEEMIEVLDALLDDSDHATVWTAPGPPPSLKQPLIKDNWEDT